MFQKKKAVVTTTNIEEKVKIEDILHEKKISYEIRMKDVHQANPFKTALLGNALGGENKPRYAWDFLVAPNDVEMVLELLSPYMEDQ